MAYESGAQVFNRPPEADINVRIKQRAVAAKVLTGLEKKLLTKKDIINKDARDAILRDTAICLFPKFG